MTDQTQPANDTPAQDAAPPAQPSVPSPQQPAASEPAKGRQASSPRPPANKGPAASTSAPVGRTPQASMPRNRHDVGFRHDVFKSDVKKCIRNTSFRALVLERVDVDHVHIYHSHNNQGRKNRRTGQACGHWHDVEHVVNPDGSTYAKCGPAMHEVTKVSPTGRTYNVVERVSFEEEIMSGEGQGQVRTIVDNHTHELVYIGSEDLSPTGIQSQLQNERALAAAMGITIDPSAVKDNSPAPMHPADGATIS